MGDRGGPPPPRVHAHVARVGQHRGIGQAQAGGLVAHAGCGRKPPERGLRVNPRHRVTAAVLSPLPRHRPGPGSRHAGRHIVESPRHLAEAPRLGDAARQGRLRRHVAVRVHRRGRVGQAHVNHLGVVDAPGGDVGKGCGGQRKRREQQRLRPRRLHHQRRRAAGRQRRGKGGDAVLAGGQVGRGRRRGRWRRERRGRRRRRRRARRQRRGLRRPRRRRGGAEGARGEEQEQRGEEEEVATRRQAPHTGAPRRGLDRHRQRSGPRASHRGAGGRPGRPKWLAARQSARGPQRVRGPLCSRSQRTRHAGRPVRYASCSLVSMRSRMQRARARA